MQNICIIALSFIYIIVKLDYNSLLLFEFQIIKTKKTSHNTFYLLFMGKCNCLFLNLQIIRRTSAFNLSSRLPKSPPSTK